MRIGKPIVGSMFSRFAVYRYNSWEWGWPWSKPVKGWKLGPLIVWWGR